jgi:hypothetical protein
MDIIYQFTEKLCCYHAAKPRPRFHILNSGLSFSEAAKNISLKFLSMDVSSRY